MGEKIEIWVYSNIKFFHNQPIIRFKQPMDQQTNPTLGATDQGTNAWLQQTKKLKIKIKPTNQSIGNDDNMIK